MIRVTVNLSAFERYMRRYDDRIRNAMGEAILSSAEIMVTQTKNVSPVDSGKLRESIKVLERAINKIVYGSEIGYAASVEYGTSDTRSNPFFRRGINLSMARVRRELVDVINRKMRGRL